MIRQTPAARGAAIALFAVPFVFLLLEAIAASAWTDPPYDYIYNWVSHLGVPGGPQHAFGQDLNSPLAWVMNTGLALYGAVAVLASVLIFRFSGGIRPLVLGVLLAAFGVGVILVSQFPGSLQAIADGSIVYHLIGAQTAMIGGNLFSIFAGLFGKRLGIGRGAALASIAAGLFGLASFVAFMLIFRSGADANFGLLERMAQYPIALGHWVFSAALLRGWRQRGSPVAVVGSAQ
ncbi:Permeases of the major facilitator superfamily [plant metagenome]|uniref:Permeases of the major facilitator superfamily n=1 Tax=plant metagenome TaxID=1297885 RepID=A0A484SH29_9ZZZZ